MKCPLKDWVKCEILPRNGLRMKWYQRTEWYLIDQVNIIWNDIIWKDIKEENDIWLPESISGESPSREKCCLLIGSTRKPSTQFHIWPSTYFHVLRSWNKRRAQRKKHPNYCPQSLLFPHFWRGEWVRFVEYVISKAYQLRKSQSIHVYRFLFNLRAPICVQKKQYARQNVSSWPLGLPPLTFIGVPNTSSTLWTSSGC